MGCQLPSPYAICTSSAVFQSPDQNELGYLVIVVPVIGGLIIGLMARFGSEKIRGHGIP